MNAVKKPSAGCYFSFLETCKFLKINHALKVSCFPSLQCFIEILPYFDSTPTIPFSTDLYVLQHSAYSGQNTTFTVLDKRFWSHTQIILFSCVRTCKSNGDKRWTKQDMLRETFNQITHTRCVVLY